MVKNGFLLTVSQRTEPVFYACDDHWIHFNLYPRGRLQQGISLLFPAAFVTF